MGIQVLGTFNEGQTGYITAAFEDEDGSTVVPTTITYRVHDLDSGDELLGDTVFSVPAASISIELPPAVNKIVDDTKDLEVHVCTVVADYASTKRITGEYRFGVVNLAFHEVT